MIIIKIKLDDTIRRLAVESAITFKTLKRFCLDMFDELSNDKLFDITYIDDDNDIISIGSDIELLEAFRLLEASKETSFTFTIQRNNTKPIKREKNCTIEVPHEEVEIPKEFKLAEPKVEEEEEENIKQEEKEKIQINEEKMEEKCQDIDMKTLESIEENLRLVSEQVSKFSENDTSSEFGNTFKEIIETIGNKLKQIASVIDEKILDPLSKAAKSTLEDFQNEIQKLKEDILKMKMQMKESLPSKKEKEEKKSIEEINCDIVMCDLGKLEEMGFMDRKLNLQLLAKYPNNLDAVILELLNHSK